MYILHMVPEVQEILEEALINKYDIDYPLAELIMAAGFFLVLSIEILVMDYNKRVAKKNRTEIVLSKIDGISAPNGVSNGGANGHSHDVIHSIDGITYEHSESDHHVSRSYILMIALSLHHFFEG